MCKGLMICVSCGFVCVTKLSLYHSEGRHLGQYAFNRINDHVQSQHKQNFTHSHMSHIEPHSVFCSDKNDLKLKGQRGYNYLLNKVYY